MSDLTGSLLILAGVIVTGVFSVVAARVKVAGDRDTAAGPDWKAYVGELRADIDALKTEVRSVERRLDKIERKYRSALAFIRRLLGAHPEHQEDVPTEIEADI